MSAALLDKLTKARLERDLYSRLLELGGASIEETEVSCGWSAIE